MTRRSSSTKGRLRRLAGLVVGLALLCCLAVGGVALAAPGDLTLAIGPLDLAAPPQASFVLQLGGASALTAGDLTKDSVRLLVDGIEVPVDSFAPAGEGVAVPIQTVLLIDESGSMQGEAIAAASAAAATFIDAMRPGDTAATQAFNEEFRTLQDFTGDKEALKASLAGLDPRRETALYDALIKALASFGPDPSGAARYVILLSDGGDTASTATLLDAIAAVRASGISVYAIGLKTDEFDSNPLERLAELSGGRYLETPDPEALVSLYGTLAKELQNQYLVGFTLPPSSAAAGDLTVEITAGGETVTAERGFFYPTTTTAPVDTTTTTQGSAVTVPTTDAAGSGIVDRFLRWSASDFVVGALVFLLVLAMLYVLSGVLFPRRDVLAEYAGAIDRQSALQPQAEGGAGGKPGVLDRTAGRLLALRGYQDPLQRMIDDASLKLRASEFALLQLVGVVVVVILAWILGAPLLLVLVLALAVVFVPLLWLSSKGTARRNAFDNQVPDTLMLLAGSLKAGQGFEQALGVAARESPEPTASEFQRVLTQLRLGVPPEDALREVADRMRSEAFDWAVLSTVIQRQVGGNLAEIYESTANVLRERDKLRRTIKTLTAEGRLSAIILIILPFAIGGMISIVNRAYLAPLIQTRMGNAMLGLAAVLMVIGIFWMRAIIRVDK
jgi:tight adherence protein B